MSAKIATKTISARLAHVAHERDLLAHSVTRLARPNAYLCTLTMPMDGPAEQVLQTAGQQLVRAICHLFEGVPADHGIAIHQITIELLSAIKSCVAVEALVHLEIDRDNHRHVLWQCKSRVDFRQNGVPVAEAHIRAMTLPRTLGHPNLLRHYARHPVVAA